MEANITISGHVQGVFFRANGQEQAQKRGLTGWIRNEADGTVSVCAQGPREAIEDFAAWCRQGPPAARVENVKIEWSEEPSAQYTEFEIRYA